MIVLFSSLLPSKGNWEKKILQDLQNCLFILPNAAYNLVKWEIKSTKMSSLHGIVSPPIGWLKPNSSSALLSNS